MNSSFRMKVLTQKIFFLISLTLTADIITCLAITSDDKYLISGSADKGIVIFDLEEKTIFSRIREAHKSIATF